jgi:hypothetical protein
MSESKLWVKSDVHADGTYGITIELGDQVRGLSTEDAYRHARAVLALAQRAEYDAAIVRQLSDKKLGLAVADAVLTVATMRTDRPTIDPADTWPIALEAGVNPDLIPFLSVWAKGVQVGQWTVADARSHALAVLETTEVVALDQSYLAFLISDEGIGLDEGTARAVVEDIVNFRSEPA